jgi:transcriptional regulator with PAS, ATPase and Fis domain
MTDYTPDFSNDQIIHESEAMVSVLRSVDKVAIYNTNVLITGESGTGKELIAKAIHHESPRRDQPFMAINCAAIPDNLLESELFGYEKGAFTGASSRKPGIFELANGGTLFLDEVGELSQSAQAKVLRVIQEKKAFRLGGTAVIPINIRIITATNRDLRRAVTEGRFREDLYYRIDVFHIHLPPLRERREDIILLIEHFLRKFNVKFKRSVLKVDEDAIAVLCDYDWPGNVRELENAIEATVIISNGEMIALNDIPQKYRSCRQCEMGSGSQRDNDAQMHEAKGCEKLCASILRKEIQAGWQLKIYARNLGIWPKGRGVAGLGRKLLKAFEIKRELFKNFNQEDVKTIFDLLYLINPSFKKEQSENVTRLLDSWPAQIDPPAK